MRDPPNGSMPAAASTAIGETLLGPVRTARVLGAFGAAVYVAVEPADGTGQAPPVLAVVAQDGVRLPNALVLGQPAATVSLVRAAGDAQVGGGRLRAGDLSVHAARWWDPRPRLPTVAPAALAGRAGQLGSVAVPDVVAEPAGRLALAVAALDDAQACQAAGRLIGAGEGLTPAGDDVVAGLLGSMRLLGRAVAGGAGQAAVDGFVDRLARFVGAHAPGRTPALSASLLAHAGRGEVAGPAARVLLSLTGQGPVAPAVAALRRVGHTSGRDLLLGIRMGTSAVLAAVCVQAGAA